MIIDTRYSIGDPVYIATSSQVKKKIVNAINISGLKNTVKYGFESPNNLFFSFYSDGYNWYEETELFDTQESALEQMEKLKLKEAEEEKKKEAKRIKDLEEEIERKENDLKKLKRGEPVNGFDED